MALANVGLELARTGRRVLLVDFDLEAPGLDTFAILKPDYQRAGIVDYITSYRQSGTAPNVREFMYEPDITAKLPGRIWVMPTGKQDEQYASRLNSINWQELYSEQDGYILFEDLKEQWHKTLDPDYVLIDSRTGHTDVGGICTRQLPHAVAVLFFPNEQNRRGIEVVVRSVRKENQESKRAIELCFIASNVPDLDDEESILQDRLDHFRRTIDYPRLDGIIHQYDSLSLLQQTIFTIERPQTRLAQEYRLLTARLIAENLEDRRVVLGALEQLANGGEAFHAPTIAGLNVRFKEILTRYRGDGEVLYSLARANQFLGKTEIAKTLFAEARSLGFESADVRIENAILCYDVGASEEARRLLRAVVEQNVQQVFQLQRAFELVVDRDVEFLTELVGVLNAGTVRPTDRIRISRLIATKDRALEAVDRLLTPILQSEADVVERESAEYELALCRIAQKRFEAAMKLIAPDPLLLNELGIGQSFNYAMAEWGATGHPPMGLFRRVLLIHEQSPRDTGPNYLQCIAIASFVIGRLPDAQNYINLAREAINHAEVNQEELIEDESTEEEKIFSAWRYLYVDRVVLRQDLHSLERMVAGGEDRPLMFSHVRK
jgi:MinD-like ATPase involved in chromosome partitioning or flagellar assembly